MADLLPAGFEALEPYVATFAKERTVDRAQARSDSTAEERRAFHEAAKDLVASALDMLDAKPFREYDAREQRLLDLMLAFAHVALAVEVQGPDEARHAQLRKYMTITRSTADAVA